MQRHIGNLRYFVIDIQQLTTPLKIIFLAKFGDCFGNLLGNKCTKFHS